MTAQGEHSALLLALCKGLSAWGVGRGSRGGQQQSSTHLARATLIRQPPLKSFSFFLCMAGVNPKP